MKYEVEITDSGNSSVTFNVDSVSYQTSGGGLETGKGTLSITIIDSGYDIYSSDKGIWHEWLNSCCNTHDENEEEIDGKDRLMDVKVTIINDDGEDVIEIELEKARLDHFSFTTSNNDKNPDSYQAVIARSFGGGNASSKAFVKYLA